MQRNLDRLADDVFDVLILGGGINGLATAWDATLRGLKAALIEKDDFGAATSSATLKLIHGGLRYLQHLDLVRMRESIYERSTMLRIAPHLVAPIPILIGAQGHGFKGREILSMGVMTNDIISCDRNRYLPDPDRRIPTGRIWLSRKTCADMAPVLDMGKSTGGVLFYDAQMENSERCSLCFALSADARGASLANYVRADGFVREDRRLIGVKAQDLLSDRSLVIRARCFVNMTGPWSDITLGLLNRPDPPRQVLRSKGIQIMLPSLSRRVGFGVVSRHRDPDAVLDRGGRHFFVIPWRGISMAGTTDTVYKGDPEDFRITERDIHEFLDDLNASMPQAKLQREDVTFAVGGLRPVTEKNLESGSTVSRRYEVNDHVRDLGIDNLVTAIGVKYTTCRYLAQKMVNLVYRKLGHDPTRCTTDQTPILGGDIERVASFIASVIEQHPAYPEKVMRHLAATYGTAYGEVLALTEQEPCLAALLPGSDEILSAEVVHACRNECAAHLNDIVFRRTDLGTKGHPGKTALEACANLAAKELDWTDRQKDAELANVEQRYRFDP